MSKRSVTIEMEWESSGFHCVVVMTPMGHRCGYVGVPQSHPLWGKDYSESVKVKKRALKKLTCEKISPISLLCADSVTFKNGIVEIVLLFDIHGGITFSGSATGMLQDEDSLWFFGYDCAHSGDAPAVPELSSFASYDGVVRILGYCVAECEKLAEGLKNVKSILKR